MATIIKPRDDLMAKIRGYPLKKIVVTPEYIHLNGKKYEYDNYARNSLFRAIEGSLGYHVEESYINHALKDSRGLRVKITCTQAQLVSRTGGKIEWFAPASVHPRIDEKFIGHVHQAIRKHHDDHVELTMHCQCGKHHAADLHFEHLKVLRFGAGHLTLVCRLLNHECRYIATAGLTDGEAIMRFPGSFMRVFAYLCDPDIHIHAVHAIISDGARSMASILKAIIRKALDEKAQAFCRAVSESMDRIAKSGVPDSLERYEAEMTDGKAIADMLSPTSLQNDDLTYRALQLMNQSRPPEWTHFKRKSSKKQKRGTKKENYLKPRKP